MQTLSRELINKVKGNRQSGSQVVRVTYIKKDLCITLRSAVVFIYYVHWAAGFFGLMLGEGYRNTQTHRQKGMQVVQTLINALRCSPFVYHHQFNSFRH